MKRFLILCVLAATPLHAETVSRQDICAVTGEMSEQIMMARQSGVSLSRVMGIAGKVDANFRPLVEEIIKEAYWRPRMNAPENQRREAHNFRNEMEFMCYEAN